ncbi:hypothetical protein NZD89_02510 [Alicyclobacillus fastidiosus]|uniref:Virion structural protein n=1 Tax=Alicyclobacillus fastidiosus TaxID=392011 RepID=A0ABY6ZIT1_9BACL|nr:hypothetical protein [Alicyclobacillus fastidiosus]WAH42397.1 hypothetical protein NZD89_02510 [Alicyclobacillus fastidiosus]GMA64213.1 hypothetical protein GCM10025859_46530 [Alicyclobacillus fastidiosus]
MSMSNTEKPKYVITVNDDQDLLNPASYHIEPVQVLQRSEVESTVISDTLGEFRVKTENIYENEIEAQKRCYLVANDVSRKRTARIIAEGDLPAHILPNFDPFITTNPLRVLERNTAVMIQTNTVTSTANVQKVIQIMAMTVEDINMMMMLCNLMTFVNDYAKKLLGKYIIVELSSLFILFNGGSDVKGLKDFNTDYANQEYRQLLSTIRNLEKTCSFRLIRDKVAAHKDSNLDMQGYISIWNRITYKSIDAYKRALYDHLDKVLQKYYPHEYVDYFKMNYSTLNGLMMTAKEGYESFGDYEV